MNKVELISLYDIEPEFEERKPPDLEIINQKSFVIQFEKINCAKQFKYIWNNNQQLLENILANKNSKNRFKEAKKLAVEQIFSEEVRNKNTLNNENTNKNKFKKRM